VDQYIIDLEPRIDRLTLQGQHAEDALVNPPQWLATHEPFESFKPECKLSEGQRSLSAETS